MTNEIEKAEKIAITLKQVDIIRYLINAQTDIGNLRGEARDAIELIEKRARRDNLFGTTIRAPLNFKRNWDSEVTEAVFKIELYIQNVYRYATLCKKFPDIDGFGIILHNELDYIGSALKEKIQINTDFRNSLMARAPTYDDRGILKLLSVRANEFYH